LDDGHNILYFNGRNRWNPQRRDYEKFGGYAADETFLQRKNQKSNERNNSCLYMSLVFLASSLDCGGIAVKNIWIGIQDIFTLYL